MEQKLQLNPVTKINNGEKVIILEPTDIQFHMNGRAPKSVGGLIERSIENNKPGRIFGPLKKPMIKSAQDDNSMNFALPINLEDPSLKDMIKKYQEQGYRVMIKKPKEGLPVYLGKDVEEFINSKNGKRILRGFAKNKKQE